MSDLFGVPFTYLCDMLAKAYADRQWAEAKHIMQVMQSRLSEAQYPDFP